jgi:HEAT repeat protein
MRKPTGVLVAGLMLASGCTSVPELITMLRSDIGKAQATASAKLGAMGPKAVPRLLILLGEKEADARARACIVFGKIGARAHEAIPALVRALGDESAQVGRCSAWALSRIGPLASEALLEKRKDKDPAVKALVIWALAEIYPQPREAVGIFAAALRADDVRVRKAAADGLAKLGSRARDAVGVLIDVTCDPDVEVRSSAIAALGYIGADAKEAVPALATALQRETPALKVLSLRALRRMGPSARLAAGAIAPLLADKSDLTLRKEAMLALADIGIVPKGHLAQFLEALEDHDVVLGSSSASGLAGRVMRRTGRQLFTPLVELSHAGEEADRRRAVWAMGYARTTGAIVAELTEFLEDESTVIRAVAARGLGEHGRAAASAAFALTRLLGDDDPAVRSAAAAAIRKVAPGR